MSLPVSYVWNTVSCQSVLPPVVAASVMWIASWTSFRAEGPSAESRSLTGGCWAWSGEGSGAFSCPGLWLAAAGAGPEGFKCFRLSRPLTDCCWGWSGGVQVLSVVQASDWLLFGLVWGGSGASGCRGLWLAGAGVGPEGVQVLPVVEASYWLVLGLVRRGFRCFRLSRPLTGWCWGWSGGDQVLPVVVPLVVAVAATFPPPHLNLYGDGRGNYHDLVIF